MEAGFHCVFLVWRLSNSAWLAGFNVRHALPLIIVKIKQTAKTVFARVFSAS
jgi:hypothetical protein